MSSGVRSVTRMRQADLPAVVAIDAEAFPEPWDADAFRSELLAPHSRPLVVRDDTRVMGYAIAWRVGGDVEIHRIAVARQALRTGLGAFLLDHLIAIERYEGAEAFHLEVRASNAPAIGLYRNAGFEAVGVRRAYYGDGEDAVIMRLTVGT